MTVVSSTDAELLWVDFETTGISHVEPWSAVLEVHFTTTDGSGDILRSSGMVLPYPENVLAYILSHLDNYTSRMHAESGLIDDLWACAKPVFEPTIFKDRTRSMRMSQFIGMTSSNVQSYIRDTVFPNLELNYKTHRLHMAGASVHFDRRWMAAFFPLIENGFHYRNLDVSTIRKCVKLVNPELAEMEPKRNPAHRAEKDIIDEIAYYKWAQENFFRTRGDE